VSLPPDPWYEKYGDLPLGRYIVEGGKLTAAFADINSFSGLVESLRRADRRDVELVAMFAVAGLVREAIREASPDGQVANERLVRWLAGPPTARPLNDY
jgi:hypothetical protein